MAAKKGFPNTQEKAILDHYFGGTALATPETTLKIDLLTTMPTDDAGTGLVKASYTGYVQKSVTNNSTNFPAATGADPSVKSNGVAFTFGEKTDAGSITVLGWVIYKNDGTTIIQIGSVTSQAVAQDDTPEFAIGDMDIKLGDSDDTY